MGLSGGLPRADRSGFYVATTAEPRCQRRSPGRGGGTGERPGSPPFPRPELVLWALLRRGYAQGGRAERSWGVLGMGGHTYRATWAPHAATRCAGVQREGRGRGQAVAPAATGPYGIARWRSASKHLVEDGVEGGGGIRATVACHNIKRYNGDGSACGAVAGHTIRLRGEACTCDASMHAA